ncbi:BA75_02588T0 [Komagataella pastoris]|uniref:BA75_02588T0 n=1 Tax=Komagataella pastoris TaxID=4922 RepID=A0A1B2JAM6_PICPA|nr:BA75_02588T0 [Komagataella pastoris]
MPRVYKRPRRRVISTILKYLTIIATIASISVFFVGVPSKIFASKKLDNLFIFETKDVSVSGIDLGAGTVNLTVSGSIVKNYTYSNPFLVKASHMIREVNVQTSEIELFGDVKKSVSKLGKAQVQPFELNVEYDKKQDIQWIVTVKPKVRKMISIIEKLVDDPDALLRLRGDTLVKLGLINGYLPLFRFKIYLDETISVD